jgi:hypothetical protein
MIPILGDIIAEVGKTVRQVVPDPAKQAEVDLEFAKLQDQALARENELLTGQIEVNKVEAASSNVFVSGWRPYIGWVCGTIFAYSGLVAPILQWVAALNGVHTELPVLDQGALQSVLFGILGLGTLRTYEKTKAPPPTPVPKSGRW